MYRIRFHGRGGQGVKTAAHILGSAFFNEGYEVQDAPRYGAERRGAPLFAYVRAAKHPILERGVITRPDLVIVADETLVPIPAAGILSGAHRDTVLLINTAEPSEVWKARLNYVGPIVTLPVGSETTAEEETPFVGATCAGAAARLVGVIPAPSLEQAIREELAVLGEKTLAANVERALAAYHAVARNAAMVREGAEAEARDYVRPAWIELPMEEPHLSAPDIRKPATSVEVKTGLWRTMRPVIDYPHCNRCSWVCSTLCPDSAIAVDAEGRPRIDYDHCKGCLICVAVCPPHAIRAVPERLAQEESTT